MRAIVLSITVLSAMLATTAARAEPGCHDGDDGADDHCCPLGRITVLDWDSNDLLACIPTQGMCPDDLGSTAPGRALDRVCPAPAAFK